MSKRTGDGAGDRAAARLHLSSSVEFVGQFDFAEGNRCFHPVGSKVGGVGVDVHTAGALRLRLSAWNPLSIHVLPAVIICSHKVQQHRVHGVGVQTANTRPEHREHPSETKPNQTHTNTETLALGSPSNRRLTLASL